VQVLSMCEAILEDPMAVLLRQQERDRRERLGELKAAGVEYEERIEIIEKIQDLEGAIAFCGMTRTIAKTFTIMGLGQFARMAESELDAISAVT
jgi:hypothetical protein